jgi:hypothetical protein
MKYPPYPTKRKYRNRLRKEWKKDMEKRNLRLDDEKTGRGR